MAETETNMSNGSENLVALPSSKTRTRRMQVLRDVMDKTISSLTNSVRLVKPIEKINKDVLRNLHSQALSQLEENVKVELEQIYSEENVENLLDKLDTLVQQSSPDGPSWAPSGDVDADLRAHIVGLKREKLKVLEKTLKELEAKNKMLVDKVTRSEAHLLQSRNTLLNTVQDFEELNDKHASILEEVEDVVLSPD